MRSFALIFAMAASAAAQPAWTLSTTPIVEIGDESRPETQFTGVRGVLRMPRGEIVVSNSRTRELRVFSPAGAYLRAISRRGKGPGEFETLGQLFRVGDTIYAVEPNFGLTWLQVYTANGFVRKHSLRAPELGAGGAAPVGRFTSGRLGITQALRIVQDAPPGRIVDDSVTRGILTLGDPNVVTIIGRTVDQQLVSFPSPMVAGRSAAWPFPFGRSTFAVVSGDRLWIGDTDTGELTLFDERGRRSGVLRAPIMARPFDVVGVRRAREAPVESNASPFKKAGLQAVRDTPLPRWAPRFGKLLAGIDGEIWIQKYRESPDAQMEFVVVNRDGQTIGGLALPAATTLHEVGRDYVTAVRTDEDGIEHVVVYGLSRSR